MYGGSRAVSRVGIERRGVGGWVGGGRSHGWTIPVVAVVVVVVVLVVVVVSYIHGDARVKSKTLFCLCSLVP